MTKCEHPDFAAFVEVNRLTASDDDPTVVGFTAEIRIECAVCSEPFLFRGVPVGMLPYRPAMSVDRMELRVPISPRGADESFGRNIPGFTVEAYVRDPERDALKNRGMDN